MKPQSTPTLSRNISDQSAASCVTTRSLPEYNGSLCATTTTTPPAAPAVAASVSDIRTDLVTTFRLRIHAANLARSSAGWGGVWKQKLPDSYAHIVMTNTKSPNGSSSLPLLPKPLAVAQTSRHFSTASDDSFQLAEPEFQVILGTTEVILQNRNPQWTQTVLIDYEYGSVFHFTVHVLQSSAGGAKVSDGAASNTNTNTTIRSIGSALFEVGDILGTQYLTKVKRLPNKGGCIFCQLEPVQANHLQEKVVHLQLSARNLVAPKRRLRGNLFHRDPDTVLEIAKHSADDAFRQAWVTVYRSQPVLNSSNPDWDPVALNLGPLCNGQLDKHLRISIKTVKAGHSDELVGMTETTLNHLRMAVQQHESSRSAMGLENASDNGGGDGTDRPATDAAAETNNSDRIETSAGHEMLLQRSIQRGLSKLNECGTLKVKRAEIESLDDAMRSSERSNSNTVVGTTMEDNARIWEAEVVGVVDLTSLPPAAAPIAARFDNYMRQDCDIDFCVAVDFTSSNGDPRKEGSLHFQSPDLLNDYEETITAIGEALDVFSKTKDYSVWGFGAKFGGEVRHVFQCGATSTVQGVEGILTAYKSVFATDLIMSGPTDFRSVIHASAVQAHKYHLSATESSLQYTVLLVITDGVMENLQETQQKLASYSEVPLSVVFVGVGRSDFGPMYRLCESHGRRCTTTFVEFRQHQHDPAALGEALRHVPAQLCEYMDLRGFR